MPKKVRSQLFHAAASMSEKFGEHMAIIWELPPEKQAILLESVPAVLMAETERGQMVAREAAVKRIGGDSQKAMEAIQALHFIGLSWSPVRDDVRTVLSDIEALHVLPKEAGSKAKARTFLKKYLEFLKRDSQRRLYRTFAARLLKNLKGMEAVIDHRVIIKSEFDWKGDDPRSYQPVGAGTVPVALIRINLDEGDPIVFQCEQKELEMMDRLLQATIKEMASSLRLTRR